MYHLMPATIIKRLMLNFISNPQAIFKDIQDAVDNYLLGKFQLLGRDLGDIMHLILTFAMDRPLISFNDYLKIIKGFFTGMNIKHEVDEILKCIEKIPNAFTVLIRIINELKNINLNDIKVLIETIMKIYSQVKEILVSLTPCAETAPEFKSILDKLLSLGFGQVIKIVTKNFLMIYNTFLDAEKLFVEGKYEEFGKVIGNLIYQLFLTPKSIDFE